MIIFLRGYCSGQFFGTRILFYFCSAKSRKNFFLWFKIIILSSSHKKNLFSLFLSQEFLFGKTNLVTLNQKCHSPSLNDIGWAKPSSQTKKNKIVVSQTVSAL